MEISKKKPTNYIIILSMLIMFISILFTFFYTHVRKISYDPYENSLNVYINIINKANISTANFIKGGTINTEMAKSNIPNIITTLQKSRDKILASNPKEELKQYQNSLIEGLTYNINMYVQLLNILNNPEAKDLSESIKNVNNLKEACMTSYSQVVIGKIKIGLQKNTVDFIDTSTYSLDQLVKIKKNQDILASQNTDFIKEIDETFKNFQIIKTDFKSYLYNVRNNNGSYNDLINLIIKNKADLTNLKIDLTNISIPQKSLNSNPIVVFNTLKSAINDYDLYLNLFTYTLSNEKVQASVKIIDKNTADKLYMDTDLKMAKVTKEYNDFIEIYNNFKDIK